MLWLVIATWMSQLGPIRLEACADLREVRQQLEEDTTFSAHIEASLAALRRETRKPASRRALARVQRPIAALVAWDAEVEKDLAAHCRCDAAAPSPACQDRLERARQRHIALWDAFYHPCSDEAAKLRAKDPDTAEALGSLCEIVPGVD